MSTRADKQATTLQACLDRIAAGEPVEAVLRDVGADDELTALVELAVATREQAPTRTPPAARARMQAALQDQMATRTAATTPGRPWSRLLLRAAALVTAVVLGLGSAVVVSANSLPGDTLYPVKRATEQARLALAIGPAARAEVYLDLTARRLDELETLPPDATAARAAIAADLVATQRAAHDSAAEADDPALETAVASTTADHLRRLTALEDGPLLADTMAALRALRGDVPSDGARAPSPTPIRPSATSTATLAPTDQPTVTRSAATATDQPVRRTATVASSATTAPSATATARPPTAAPTQPSPEPPPTVAPTQPPPEPTAAATDAPPENPRATERAATTTPGG